MHVYMMHKKLGEGMRNEKNKLIKETGIKGKSRGKGGTLIKQRSLLSKAVRRHLSGSYMKIMGMERHELG